MFHPCYTYKPLLTFLYLATEGHKEKFYQQNAEIMQNFIAFSWKDGDKNP